MAGKVISHSDARKRYEKYIQRPSNTKVLGKKMSPTDKGFYFAYGIYKDALRNKGYTIK